MKRAKGRVIEATNDLKEALAILKEVLAKSDGNNFNIGIAYLELGELSLDHNSPCEALRHFENAMKHWHGIYGEGDMTGNEWVATTYGFMARCYMENGNRKLAHDYKEKCMDIITKIKKK